MIQSISRCSCAWFRNLSNWAALAVGQLQQADNHVRFREGICVCLGLSAAISSSTFAGQLIESGIAGTVIPRILNVRHEPNKSRSS